MALALALALAWALALEGGGWRVDVGRWTLDVGRWPWPWPGLLCGVETLEGRSFPTEEGSLDVRWFDHGGRERSKRVLEVSSMIDFSEVGATSSKIRHFIWFTSEFDR